MKLSATIMAHPSRKSFVTELKKALDRPVRATWDRENSLWETGRRALLAYRRDADYHLVIQDDAIVCRDLLAGVERALPYANGRPISLYAGMYRPPEKAAAIGDAKKRMAEQVEAAQTDPSPWFEYEGPWWGVAIAVPTADIPALVEYGDNWTRGRNYDARIGSFYIDRGIPCLYAMPSLVDHRPPALNPSIIGNDIHLPVEVGRCAHEFVGPEMSALDIDWSTTPFRVRDTTGRRVNPLDLVVPDGQPFDTFASNHADACTLAALHVEGTRFALGGRPVRNTLVLPARKLQARLLARRNRLLVVARDSDLRLVPARRPAVSAERVLSPLVLEQQLTGLNIEVIRED